MHGERDLIIPYLGHLPPAAAASFCCRGDLRRRGFCAAPPAELNWAPSTLKPFKTHKASFLHLPGGKIYHPARQHCIHGHALRADSLRAAAIQFAQALTRSYLFLSPQVFPSRPSHDDGAQEQREDNWVGLMATVTSMMPRVEEGGVRGHPLYHHSLGHAIGRTVCPRTHHTHRP